MEYLDASTYLTTAKVHKLGVSPMDRRLRKIVEFVAVYWKESDEWALRMWVRREMDALGRPFQDVALASLIREMMKRREDERALRLWRQDAARSYRARMVDMISAECGRFREDNLYNVVRQSPPDSYENGLRRLWRKTRIVSKRLTRRDSKSYQQAKTTNLSRLSYEWRLRRP